MWERLRSKYGALWLRLHGDAVRAAGCEAAPLSGADVEWTTAAVGSVLGASALLLFVALRCREAVDGSQCPLFVPPPPTTGLKALL